jgi:hypothetical protein
MKAVCITGVIPQDLSYIQGIMTQAGMSVARPAKKDDTLNIDFWHTQVKSRLQEFDPEEAPAVPGRVWEQLASDIFLANLDLSVWGWSVQLSYPVLEFWQRFDPQIRFVLVACSLQRYISYALESEDPFTSVNVLVDRWIRHHREMLQFHRQYPKKTLLLDIDQCIDSSIELVKVCEKSWKLGLSKVHYPEPIAREFSVITDFLSNELCKVDDSWQIIQEELFARLDAKDNFLKKRVSSGIEDVIRAYREDTLRSRKSLNISQNLQTEREAVLEKKITQFQDQYEQLSSSALEEKKNEPGLPIDLANCSQKVSPANDVTIISAQLEAFQARHNEIAAQKKDLAEQAELLLLELHQVQVELEHYFLQYQESKRLLEDADQRWQRMLVRMPDYFDLDRVEITGSSETSNRALNWRIKDLDAAGRQIPELSLKTFVVGDVACLELPRRVDNEELFLRWPVASSSSDAFVVALLDEGATDPQLALSLLQLGCTDWDLLNLIVGVLIKAIDTPSLLVCSEGVVIDQTAKGLRTLQERLARVAAVFRFDKLTLKREQVNPDYEHLWFNFQHVAIGEKRLLDFDFRVSCANVRPNAFGLYPKLEFPETSGRAAIDEWFDESYDDFGAKLELRFSLPRSMDMAVWGRLGLSDQLFVQQLVVQLPILLSELERSGIKLKRGWSDWCEMVKSIAAILDECTAVARPKQRSVSSRQSKFESPDFLGRSDGKY